MPDIDFPVQPSLWIAIVAMLICVFIINQVSRSRKNEHRKRINHIKFIEEPIIPESGVVA